MKGAKEARRVGLAVTLALTLGGCLEPSVGADEVPEGGGIMPPVDLFRHPDASVEPDVGHCAPAVPPAVARAVVSVETVTVHGRYWPRNVGAIWLERADRSYLRTLEEWGVRRRRYLVAWIAASAGDLVDAVTSATLRAHQVHTVEWNLLDRDHCLVEQGDYHLRLEFTERDGAGPNVDYPFTLPERPSVLPLEPMTGFQNGSITFE